MRRSLIQPTDPDGVPPPREPWWRRLNPWRHFAAALGWAMFSLVVVGALLAAEWAASEAERQVAAAARVRLQQTANQAADALLTQLQLRLAAMRATAAQWPLQPERGADWQARLAALQIQQPELGWLGAIDGQGRWLAATAALQDADLLPGQAWLARARLAPVVVLHRSHAQGALDTLVLAVPMMAREGAAPGVLLAQLPWLWLQAELDAQLRAIGDGTPVELLLTGPGGQVLAGPASARALPPGGDLSAAGRYLLGHASAAPAADAGAGQASPEAVWQLWVREAAAQALAPARQTHRAVLMGVLVVGLLAALAAVVVARWLLRRLDALARQAQQVGQGRRQAVDIPTGRDEVHVIGVTLAQLIGHWQDEKAALTRLNADLDARVAARTARIERLAQDARHAAVTRERLRLARGLHDTLAHSLMALLTQIRLMRKLGPSWSREQLDAELADTETLAASGLAEARAAIGQMRDAGVHDNGLGPELQALLQRFAERSAAQVEAHIDAAAADLVDERAAMVLAMAREALRNVERHAGAHQVSLSLAPLDAPDAGGDAPAPWRLVLRDDGCGFDPGAIPDGHFGLVGLREQAQQLGATLHIDSAPGQGCRVQLDFAG
ncbi:sensor histidine kinase [Diaphorobacter limosus]|uniref:Histidine kinase n=1 Tax=Diaphorobacter limosus TaxID=3036128 RepID=A0ABZ0IZ65_9BURK|nr:histidine kinase [Diaphorobacter sp. Y-1]WOO31275.1 histidine kinase [Diaphorobacter sp. Y-1]